MKTRTNESMAKFNFLAAMAMTLMTAVADANAGHGVGSGDGFPTVTFESKTLEYVPAREELDRFARNLVHDYPTIAHRFILLMRRFDKDPNAMKIKHLLGDYPFELANSRSSDGKDITGLLPAGVEIVVWNEFFRLSEREKAVVLLHEFIHVLFTRAEEERTALITELLTPYFDSHGDSEAVSRIQDGRLPRPRVSTKQHNEFMREILNKGEHSPDSEYEQIRDLYLDVLGKKEPCSEFTTVWEKVEGTPASIPYPIPPRGFLKKVEQDHFFEFYRAECLSRTAGGRAVLEGFYAHPLLHAGFLRAITGAAVTFGLPSKRHRTAEASPAVNGRPRIGLLAPLTHPNTKEAPATLEAAPYLRKVKMGLQLKASEFEHRVPGFSTWRKYRDLNLLPSERAKPLEYHSGRLLRFPLDWLNYLKSSRVVFELNRPEWKGVPALVTTNGDESGACRFLRTKPGTREIALQCRYQSPALFGILPSTERRWRLTELWAAHLFRDNSPVKQPLWESIMIDTEDGYAR